MAEDAARRATTREVADAWESLFRTQVTVLRRLQDDDVWDMEFFAHSTHVSPPEREAFRAIVDAGFDDVVRPFTPGEFTYWDYTQLRFPKKQGMRIDFVLASAALAKRVTGAMIDRQERKGKGASDHAPVVVELA